VTARWRKVRADVLGDRSRSLLAITSIAIGTMAVGAMHLAGVTVGSSFRSDFLASNPPSAMLRTEPFDAGLVERIESHPAVASAEGRRLLPVRLAPAVGDPTTVELVAMDFTLNDTARIENEDGVWPPRVGDLVIERASVSELGVAVGDRVAVEAPGREPVELTVSGVAHDVWEMAPTLGAPTRAYVHAGTMTAVVGDDRLDALYLRSAVDPLDREAAVAAATAVRDDVLGPAGVSITQSEIREPGEHRAERSLTFVVRAMQLLAGLCLLVAMALVVNTVTALLTQQRRQIGAMKAVGARSGQLTVQYLGTVIVLSAVAFAVAVPVSLLLGRFLAGFAAGLGNFDLEPLSPPVSTIALQAAVAIALPATAVWLVVRRAARRSVQEVLADRGITQAVRPGRRRLPLTRPARLAYRNATRNPARLVLTIATIGLCGGVLVGVLSTQRSLQQLVDEVAAYRAYDLQLTLTEPVPLDDVRRGLQAVPDVAETEGWYLGQAFHVRPDGTEDENVTVVAAPVGSSALQPTLRHGRWLRTDDDHGVVVNVHFVDEMGGVAVGEEVVLEIEGRRRPWRVVGIASTTLVGPIAYLSVGELGTLLEREGAVNLVAVDVDDGADHAEAARQVEAAARAAGLPVAGVQTGAALRAGISDLLNLVVGLLLLVGIVLAVVAVVGVAGTMTLGVAEQTREIGVLRAIGASTAAVRLLLVRQGMALAVLGGVVGVALSLPVAAALRSLIDDGLIGDTVPFAFSGPGVAAWALAALLIGALGATRPARVAARLTVRDTLDYE
jgi:putative ABC transport system permease protein